MIKTIFKALAALVALVVIVGVLAYGWAYFNYQSFHDFTTPYRAKGWVKSQLVDPQSAIFRNQKGYCGEVNSKNRMGGYGGFVRFIALGPEKYDVMIEGATYSDFNEMWRDYCELSRKEWEIQYCKRNPDRPYC